MRECRRIPRSRVQRSRLSKSDNADENGTKEAPNAGGEGDKEASFEAGVVQETDARLSLQRRKGICKVRKLGRLKGKAMEMRKERMDLGQAVETEYKAEGKEKTKAEGRLCVYVEG